MSRYNEFVASIECPFCGRSSEVEFQADIGTLEYHRFNPGDAVFGLPHEMRRSPVGPSPELIDADFWAYGVGLCPHCKKELWARIEIRANRFDSLQLVPQPENPDACVDRKALPQDNGFMTTAEQLSAIPPALMAELQEAADRAAKGIRDPKVMGAAAASMDCLREEIRRKHGLLDIGVPALRELRDLE